MSFDKLQYDVVLIETPTKYVVERYDQPKYTAIGVAYVGNYLEKNVGDDSRHCFEFCSVFGVSDQTISH